MRALIFFACLLMVLAGCGSRKKEVERSESEKKLEINADTTSATQVNAGTFEAAKAETKTEAESEQSGVDVGPGGKAVIEEFDADGNMKKRTTIENNGSSKKSSDKTKSESKAEVNRQDTLTYNNDYHGTYNLEASENSKIVTKKTDRKSFSWLWVLGLVVLAYLIYRRITQR